MLLIMLVQILFHMLYYRDVGVVWQQLEDAGRSLEISCPNEGRGLQRCWCLFPACQLKISRFSIRCNSSFSSSAYSSSYFSFAPGVLLLQLGVTVGFNCCEHRELRLHLGTPGPEHMPDRMPEYGRIFDNICWNIVEVCHVYPCIFSR